MPARNCNYKHLFEFIFCALMFLGVFYKIVEVVVHAFRQAYKW